MTWHITVDGHYAYIACWWDGVRIIDFSDPSNPTCVAHVLGWYSGAPPEDYCYAEDVAKSGNYLYIIDYGPFPNDDTKGLYIVDVSNPQDPVVIYRYSDLQSEGYGIDAIGNYVYVADKNGGLEVIDVSDPLNPATTAYCPLPDVAYDVTVSGNYAYVANYILGGLQVVDVSDPSSPFIAGYYKRTGCFAMKAATQGNLVYVADGPAGFQVYNHIALQPGIDDEYSETSLSILYQNSPNPFRYSTTFKFSLKEASYVKLSVYNIRGQQLATIVDENMKPGYYEIPWSPANEDHALTNGIYYYKLEVGDKTFVKKMMLMR
ncbi:MAG TPA: hypothetical protein DCP10_01630 [Bacteroidales bacterium]|nr:hypothetical protein [Bacteroidales bacterium]